VKLSFLTITTTRFARSNASKSLAGHEVRIWNDLSSRCRCAGRAAADTEALVLIRERTEIRAPPAPRSTSQAHSSAAVYPHTTSTLAGARRRVSSSQHPGTPSHAARGAYLGAGACGDAQVPQQMSALKGEWQIGVGNRPARRDAGNLRLRQDRGASSAGYGKAFG